MVTRRVSEDEGKLFPRLRVLRRRVSNKMTALLMA